MTFKEWFDDMQERYQAYYGGYEELLQEAFEAGAKQEREACAKVCDDKVDAEYATGKVDHNEMGWTQSCAIAIRARSEA